MPIHTDSLENTTVHIQINNRETRLSAIYKRPQNALLRQDIENLLDTGLPTILAGDKTILAKHPVWNSQRTNTADLVLLNHMEENNYLVVAPDTLTHHPDQRHHQPDVLDIAILKNINLQYQLCNFTDELSSDHSPVILTLHGKPLADPPKPTRTITNWPKFAVQLHVAISSPNPSINSISELDQEIRDFTTMIQEVLSKNTSELNKQPNQTLLSDSIKRELTKKRRLRRAWQNTRNPEAKHRFNNQTSKVKRLLQHHKESAWRSFLAELKPGDTKIFKINKSLINRTPPNRPLNSHLGPVFDSPGKSELFATNLATQFNCPDGNQATNQLVANSMRTITTSIKSPIQSVSPGEMQQSVAVQRSTSSSSESTFSVRSSKFIVSIQGTPTIQLVIIVHSLSSTKPPISHPALLIKSRFPVGTYETDATYLSGPDVRCRTPPLPNKSHRYGPYRTQQT
ncbi:hypothetical protein ACI65C_000773 [Semiaphis heraclei]